MYLPFWRSHAVESQAQYAGIPRCVTVGPLPVQCYPKAKRNRENKDERIAQRYEREFNPQV
jgi:hypothetical protein